MRLLALIALFTTGFLVGVSHAEPLVPLTSYIVTPVTDAGSEISDATISPVIGGLSNAGLPTTVRLVCSADCFIAVSGPFTTIATSVAVYLPLDKPELFRLRQGDTIIVVRDTANGVLYITEMSR